MGRIDVDAMIAELTPEQFKELQAYHVLEPWGDDWRRSATVAAMAWNSALLAMGALKDPPGPMTPSECIPYWTVEPQRERPLPDPVAITAALEERYG